jgi:hypothetical protein
LPREFPPFTTVQHYFYGWRDGGVLEKTRLAKDFEASLASAKAWLYLGSIQLLIRRLARA